MSARYGSKTRSGEAVSDLGRRPTGGGGGLPNVYEEVFTAPGTWTWPGNVSEVEVLIVGGGGGGASFTPPNIIGDSGGGGGVGVLRGPVSGPVPVTVGAGGAGGSPPNSPGSDGGSSAFGPIPSPTTLIVGGGQGGSRSAIQPQPAAAFEIGGSTGSNGSAAGRYGTVGDDNTLSSGGAGGQILRSFGGADKWGYGAGNQPLNALNPSDNTFGATSGASIYGKGKGGSGSGPAGAGFVGRGGIVIVRWYE